MYVWHNGYIHHVIIHTPSLLTPEFNPRFRSSIRWLVGLVDSNESSSVLSNWQINPGVRNLVNKGLSLAYSDYVVYTFSKNHHDAFGISRLNKSILALGLEMLLKVSAEQSGNHLVQLSSLVQCFSKVFLKIFAIEISSYSGQTYHSAQSY